MRALLLLFFGLLLPSFTVAFEFFTHTCRDGLFDPLPTAWDVLLCLSLPAATVAVALGWRCGLLSGFALGICAVYATVLLPLTPFAFLAIIYFGLGLLPLSPLLGFLVLAWASQGQPARGKGFALALVVLAAVHSPVDRMLLELARTSTVGEDALRHHDLTPLVAMAAGRPSPRGVDVVSVLLSWLGPVPMGEARDVYFHVTGQPFSEVAGAETWVADHDMASDRIGTRRNGLILSRSEWKGQTWDLTFQEGAYGDEEVRALIHLPPGSVVSGATLWVKGKPVAAKFTSPVRAESAYRSTVLAARDPLVISWAGPDRVLLKVYPVSHLGQRVRLQIEGGKGQPWFEEANFSHPSVPPSCSVDRCGPPLRDEIVVVDGSAALAPHRDELTRLLRGRRVVVAGKTLVHSLEDAPRFEGGRDNAPALVWACQQKPSAVLWIHGSQPICQPTVGLAGVRLLSLSVAAGPNRVLEEVPFEEVPRTGSLREDLRGVLAQSQWKAARHPGLVEVERLLAAGDTAAARALACQKGLVTPVSSALVLEREAGNPYQPVTEPSGPPDDSAYPGKGFSFPGETVPEPCVGLLALLALPALRRRR